ncbi:MAG: threonine/serine exporter family protein [Eubacteriales bacterium]|nr:threonine/serine exporter family protein [Eubacteriales bacterium]
MNDLEYILDFAVNLGGCMLKSGANLERVNDTMNRVCLSYNLSSISIFSLSSTIILSAKSSDNISATRHLSIPSTGIHLEKLRRFNQLSRRVCSETPAPASLAGLLDEAGTVQEYSTVTVIIGYLIAMSCLCTMFGGNISDVIAADLITVVLYWTIRVLTKPQLNHIITNILCMWIAGTLAIFLVKIGLGKHYFSIVITNSMMMIPGVPLVNSVRNLLCGNEMNGILEFLKVILETVAIVLGLVISIYMFGGTIQW